MAEGKEDAPMRWGCYTTGIGWDEESNKHHATPHKCGVFGYSLGVWLG